MSSVHRKEEMPSWDYLLEYLDADGLQVVEGRIREASGVGVVLLLVCAQNNTNQRNVTRFVCAQGD